MSDYSPELLAKLAPHRAHESSWLKSLLCKLGFHRWYYLKLDASTSPQIVGLCRWCPRIKVDGALYED